MICAGIDAGSRTVKVVLLEADGLEVVAAGVVDQGVEQEALALRLFERLLENNGLDRAEVRAIVATGYGRKLIRLADATITDVFNTEYHVLAYAFSDIRPNLKVN